MTQAADTARVLKLAKARRYAASGDGRRVRLANDLSLRDVAQPVGVGITTLWRWENDRNSPRGDAAVRWADLLDQLQAAS